LEKSLIRSFRVTITPYSQQHAHQTGRIRLRHRATSYSWTTKTLINQRIKWPWTYW